MTKDQMTKDQMLSMRQSKPKTCETIQGQGKPSETSQVRRGCWSGSGDSNQKAGIVKPVNYEIQE